MNAVFPTLRRLTGGEEYDAYVTLRARVWGRQDHPSDINAYDRQAVVLGAFRPEGGLIAAVRVVTPGRDSPDLDQFRRAVSRRGLGWEACLEGPAPSRIAAEESFPLSPILDRLEHEAQPFVEIGRLTRFERSGDPWTIFRLLKHALGESNRLGYRCAFAMCTVKHLRPWSRLGFKPVPGMPVRIERYSGLECVAIWTWCR